MTSSSVLTRVGDDGGMDTAAPDPGGPRSDRPLRRSFTPAQKVEHVAAYEAACGTNQGSAVAHRRERPQVLLSDAHYFEAPTGPTARSRSGANGNPSRPFSSCCPARQVCLARYMYLFNARHLRESSLNLRTLSGNKVVWIVLGCCSVCCRSSICPS